MKKINLINYEPKFLKFVQNISCKLLLKYHVDVFYANKSPKKWTRQAKKMRIRALWNFVQKFWNHHLSEQRKSKSDKRNKQWERDPCLSTSEKLKNYGNTYVKKLTDIVQPAIEMWISILPLFFWLNVSHWWIILQP